MRDSAMKRIFWLLIFGLLVIAVGYLSFIWSLGQTIQFTSLLVTDRSAGIVVGLVVQFSPTAFLYMSTSYDKNKPDEQNMRLWWLAAFWGVSLFDGITNLGARFDDLSITGMQTSGFQNEQFAIVVQWLMIIMGVALDFAIVFGEELLGNMIGVFFDNLSALIELVGGRPPKWFAMVAATGRAVGGTGRHVNGKQPTFGDKDRGKQNNNREQNNRGRDRNSIPDMAKDRRGVPANNTDRQQRQSRQNQRRESPMGNSRQRFNPRDNVTIRNMED